MNNQEAGTIFGYEVMDTAGKKIGNVENVWVDDATGELEFIGVKTGWLMGKTHVIPATGPRVDSRRGVVTVQFDEAQIKGSPSFSGDQELNPQQEDEIYSYYGIQRSTGPSPSGLPAGETGTGGYSAQDEASVRLSEEQLQVGKREVETGRVRLRKVVRTEQQEVPVELRREEVDIQRVPASGTEVPSDAFQEREVDVTTRREEPVVAKDTYTTEEVRLGKSQETETRTVGGEVRKEDVEIEQEGR